MSRQLSLAAVLALSLLAACTDTLTTDPLRVAPLKTMSFNDVDKNPAADGYWIPGAAPDLCVASLNFNVVYNDADYDWLDQNCELTLATRFAPLMKFHSQIETCPHWQPYWAAKVFNEIRRVRIAYMPAYHQDCGQNPHHGDAEFVTVQLLHDIGSNHWMVEAMWTSAHYRASIGGISDDRSVWGPWNTLEYADRARGRPVVWVAPRKHANYRTADECARKEYSNPISDCDSRYWYPRPFPVHADRNAGSRHADLLGCVYAQAGGQNAGSGRCERFYYFTAQHPFNGWFPAPDGVGGSSIYHEILISDKFEYYTYQTFDAGPGPNPPPPPQPPGSFTVTISGPSEIGPGFGCQWAASVVGANAVSYEWRVNGQLIGTDSYVTYYNDGNDFDIQVDVTVESGAHGSSSMYVSVVEDMYCT
jgi:hypothetical protein